MGKREKFSGHIKCGSCAAEGEAHFEENENPAHNYWDFEKILEGVDKPFKIVKGAIVCECGNVVRDA